MYCITSHFFIFYFSVCGFKNFAMYVRIPSCEIMYSMLVMVFGTGLVNLFLNKLFRQYVIIKNTSIISF